MVRLTHGLICFLALCGATFGQTSSGSVDQEWRFYGHDPGGMRFSKLAQINTANVSKLKRAWTYEVDRAWQTGIDTIETTPLMVDDVLYFSTATSRVIAIDAETGKQLWLFDPFAGVAGTRRSVPNRGAAYWEGNSTGATCGGERHRRDRRIFYATLDGRLFALDPDTGKPCGDFGTGGAVDLRVGVGEKYPKNRYEVTSPPSIFKDLVITGSSLQEMPSKGPVGDIRAFDVRTGKLVWTFHTVPRPGETGHETWKGDWEDRSGANVWSIMSVDAERGMIFLPIGSPSYDFYAADRKGQGLFGNCIVALDANTGKLIWYQQLVHHDIWDYDVSCPPNLVTIHRDGRDIPAVTQGTKMGFIYVFDRVTGKPLYPVEERPVKQSLVPGEETWPTQPFPPPAFQLARTSVAMADITTVTPESRKYCLDNFGAYLPATIFNPWGLELTLQMPGSLGGENWSGTSFNPSLGYLFVNVSEVGAVGLMKPAEPGFPEAYVRSSKWGSYARFWDDHHYPCQQPPWGDLNAIDLNTGKLAWKVPLGVIDDLEAKGVPKTGVYSLGGSIATAGGLVFIGGTDDHRFRAFEAKTGKELWVTQLESNAHATPMTYMGKKTRNQYVVVAAGPGGYFNPDTSAPTVIAAYALVPKGQALAARRTLPEGTGREPQDLPPPAQPVVQPVPFSHTVHVHAGMECEGCHKPLGNSGKLSIPGMAECMACHATIKTDSPAIQQLTRMQKDDELLAWKRLYKLPPFVYFSHTTHANAKVACQVCHGPVQERNVLWQEKEVNMNTCVNCHKLRGATITCDRCHDIGH